MLHIPDGVCTVRFSTGCQSIFLLLLERQHVTAAPEGSQQTDRTNRTLGQFQSKQGRGSFWAFVQKTPEKVLLNSKKKFPAGSPRCESSEISVQKRQCKEQTDISGVSNLCSCSNRQKTNLTKEQMTKLTTIRRWLSLCVFWQRWHAGVTLYNQPERKTDPVYQRETKQAGTETDK